MIMRRLNISPPHFYAADCKFHVYGSARLARVFERPSAITVRLLAREKRTETHGLRGRLLAPNAASFATKKKKKNQETLDFMSGSEFFFSFRYEQKTPKPKLSEIVVNPFYLKKIVFMIFFYYI